ncbi:YkgB family protein [Roseovarius sp. MS2]|uniref:YkgB family protein n=1 Tax=Roseovarius sp. MS2 TaxID=3390728 RepID=UPI003EDC9736
MTDYSIQTVARHGSPLSNHGRNIAVFGLAFVFAAIGLMKFTAYEAEAIQGLVASSPLLSWLYGVFSVRGLSAAIGVVEVSAAILLALRPWSARAGAAGAAVISATLITTVTFLFTAPGWEPSLGGFPFLSVVPGQFLIKDLPLLGIALWALGDALSDLRRG